MIIVFNPGNFLAGAINSVAAQTTTDWELLLFDNGSTDECSDCADVYAASA